LFVSGRERADHFTVFGRILQILPSLVTVLLCICYFLFDSVSALDCHLADLLDEVVEFDDELRSSRNNNIFAAVAKRELATLVGGEASVPYELRPILTAERLQTRVEHVARCELQIGKVADVALLQNFLERIPDLILQLLDKVVVCSGRL